MFHGHSHTNSPPSFLHRDFGAPVTWSQSADHIISRHHSPPQNVSPRMTERDLLSHGETPSPDPFLSFTAAAPHSPSSAYSEFSSMRSFSSNAQTHAREMYYSPQATYARQQPSKTMHSMYGVHNTGGYPSNNGGYISSHPGMPGNAGYGSGGMSSIWNDSAGVYARSGSAGHIGYNGYTNPSAGYGLGPVMEAGSGARIRSETVCRGIETVAACGECGVLTCVAAA